jgi:quinol monooxygenase YgiN
MAGNEVTVFALIKAKPGMEETVKKELLALVGPTRAEEGCINYDLHQSIDQSGHYRFYENWTSKELLDRHLQSAHVQRFVAKIDQLLTEPPEITLWEMLPGGP